MLEKNIVIPLMLSVFAGLSTVLGTFIIFVSSKKSNKLITFSLSFSAGVMISVSLTDLLLSSIENLSKIHGASAGIAFSLLFMLIGGFFAFLIDKLIPDDNINENNNSLFRVGLVSTVALMIHNFPEGIATFVSGYHNTSLGISIALAISLHNIPEGIAIALPIYYSTKSKLKAFKFTFLSGLAEPLGAFIAFLFLRPYINENVLSIIFSIVAGIMIYISFTELLPKANSYKENYVYITSIFLGLCIIPLSHIYL
ncbi:zinc transporter ZupT [Clostridium sp.]|uniref:zinc transporter ZupT n=1 Tax=Clostridium sp. TaxID=1506 RepID=UPI00261E199B|nr:zinc transporter ZupT [Clostridium sp.]